MGVWPYHPGDYGSLQYVNRSFVDLNGYSKEEALGQPAMNILKYHDGKWVRVCVLVGGVERYSLSLPLPPSFSSSNFSSLLPSPHSPHSPPLYLRKMDPKHQMQS